MTIVEKINSLIGVVNTKFNKTFTNLTDAVVYAVNNSGGTGDSSSQPSISVIPLTKTQKYVLRMGSGLVSLYTASGVTTSQYVSEPVTVKAGEKYSVTASANYGTANYIFIVASDSGSVVLAGKPSDNVATPTALIDYQIIIPPDGTKLYLANTVTTSTPDMELKKLD